MAMISTPWISSNNFSKWVPRFPVPITPILMVLFLVFRVDENDGVWSVMPTPAAETVLTNLRRFILEFSMYLFNKDEF
jgi:hypothetical protein